jgi:transcriptional regulator with XRE-family HTH domain
VNTLDHLFGTQSKEDQVETNAFVLMSRFLMLIEREMEVHSITRRELAERIGTSPSYVTQLFRGHKMANIETLAKIELALGIEFDIKLDRSDSAERSHYGSGMHPKINMDPQPNSFFTDHFQLSGALIHTQSA